MGANVMGANSITVEPKDIYNTLKNNTDANNITNTYKNKRVEAFVVIAEQTKMCECKCCGCYDHDSIDARCCGVCYCCCPNKNSDKQCNCCPNDFSTYWDSGYVQTTAGYGNRAQDHNGCCCWVCFPLKFAIFFPCFLGSIGNNCINCLRQTNLNYFF